MGCRVKPGNDDWAADVLYSASEQQDRREDVMGSKTAAMVACLAALLAQGGAVRAADVSVIASTAMREVLEELVPMFERASGHKVTLSFLSGAVLPVKVKEGAQADLVVTAPQTIDDLVKAGRVEAGTRVDFVRSGAGVAVRAGVRKPDIATPDAFKNALLAAKTVGYSQGPSGVHFMTVLARLGIADQIKAKGVVPPLGQRVGTLIAKGEAEIGVQQITELLLIPGIDFVGPLPKELQANIVYATATPSNAKERQAAAALVKFCPPSPRCP
jgi:molybdate transport system substrate-binding protein